MRGDATCTLDVDFGESSRWGVAALLRASSSSTSTAGCRTTRPGQPADEAPVQIFVMGGGSGPQDRARQARPRRPLARRAGVAARARRADRRTTCTATARSRTEPAGDDAPRTFTYDPEDPVPTIGGNYCAVGEFPRAGRGHRADVGAPAQPGAAAAQHHDAGPRRPEGVGGVLHRTRAVPAAVGARGRARLPDRAARGGGRGDGPRRRSSSGSRRARSTPTSPRS